jgi:hypothetical protein
MQLAPTLQSVDGVMLDSLAAHKSQKDAACLQQEAAKSPSLPACSPGLSPIKQTLAKSERTYTGARLRRSTHPGASSATFATLPSRRVLELSKGGLVCTHLTPMLSWLTRPFITGLPFCRLNAP